MADGNEAGSQARSAGGDPPPDPPENGGGESRLDTAIKLATFVVAILLLVVLLLFFVYLALNTGATETQWQRYVYLLTGIEATGFAAVGYLFGREVHRGTAQQAEQRAEEAQGTAHRATRRAELDQARANQAEQDRGRAQREAAKHAVVATAYGKQVQVVQSRLDHLPDKILAGTPTHNPWAPNLYVPSPYPEQASNQESQEASRQSPWGGIDPSEWKDSVGQQPQDIVGEDDTDGVGDEGALDTGTDPASPPDPPQTQHDLLRSEIQEIKEFLDQPLLPPEVDA